MIIVRAEQTISHFKKKRKGEKSSNGSIVNEVIIYLSDLT